MKLPSLVRPLVSAVVESLYRAYVAIMARSGAMMYVAHPGVSSFTDTIYSISVALPATYDGTGYAAVTPWVVIDRVQDFPLYGSKRDIQKFTPIRGAVEKVKSAPDYGGGDMVVADMPLDPGQVILKAAEASQAHYSMKAEYPDGEIHYFDVLIGSLSMSPAKAGAFKLRTVALEFNRKPIEVAAP